MIENVRFGPKLLRINKYELTVIFSCNFIIQVSDINIDR